MTFEALKMGDYGAYVWSSYALALVALVIMVVAARGASNRELKAALRRNQVNQSAQQSTSGGARS
ncbi:MAG: heme exporter protein CcmD [Steroidobacter sp.]